MNRLDFALISTHVRTQTDRQKAEHAWRGTYGNNHRPRRTSARALLSCALLSKHTTRVTVGGIWKLNSNYQSWVFVLSILLTARWGVPKSAFELIHSCSHELRHDVPCLFCCFAFRKLAMKWMTVELCRRYARVTQAHRVSRLWTRHVTSFI